MKAIQVETFGGPEVLQLRKVGSREPEEKQVKIQVEAIGVNPVDTYIRSGVYPAQPDLPYIPGFDAAGIVTAAGSAVRKFKTGDRVYNFKSLSGCYAEAIVCTEDQVYRLPDNIDFTAGAALGVPYSTAFYALNYRAHAMPGETVLIHGASGGVGLAAVQIAGSKGMQVIGTAGTEQGIELIKKQGAFAALNHNEENYLAAVDELTFGDGVDLILEMLANVNLGNDLKLLSRFGRVVVIGSRGSIEIDPRESMGKNSTIMGMSLFNTTQAQLTQIHAAIYAGLSRGRYHPVIHSQLPLAKAAEAHELVMQAGVNGKIVLIP